MRFGHHKINMHAPVLWVTRVHVARACCCARLRRLLLRLGRHGRVAARDARARRAPVEVGPVERVGGRDLGTATGISHYTRDPDGNLLEFIVYDAS